MKLPNFDVSNIHVAVYVTHNNPETLLEIERFETNVRQGMYPLIEQSFHAAGMTEAERTAFTQEFHIVPRPKPEFMTFLQAVEAMHAGAVVTLDSLRDHAIFAVYRIGPHPAHGRPVILQHYNDAPEAIEPARLFGPTGTSYLQATDWIIVEPDADGKVPGGTNGFERLDALLRNGGRARAPQWPAGMYLQWRLGAGGNEMVLVHIDGPEECWPEGTCVPAEWDRIAWEEAPAE